MALMWTLFKFTHQRLLSSPVNILIHFHPSQASALLPSPVSNGITSRHILKIVVHFRFNQEHFFQHLFWIDISQAPWRQPADRNPLTDSWSSIWSLTCIGITQFRASPIFSPNALIAHSLTKSHLGNPPCLGHLMTKVGGETKENLYHGRINCQPQHHLS